MSRPVPQSFASRRTRSGPAPVNPDNVLPLEAIPSGWSLREMICIQNGTWGARIAHHSDGKQYSAYGSTPRAAVLAACEMAS